MSSIRQTASSSTLSTSSTNSNSSNTSSNAVHPASDPTPQHPPPAHHRSSTSQSTKEDTTICTDPNSSLSLYSPSPLPHHHHKDTHSNSHLSADEPLIHAVKAKSEAKYNKKGSRGCMAQFDFTYSGLYVSGSKYGRKTLGTGTGAGGSGECVMM